MLSKTLEKALNDQLNWELYSSYVYYAMASWFESQDLPGFASWMQVQVKEELSHVDKFFHFINERDGRVKLAAIPEPAFEWKTPIDAFQVAYEHECDVSRRIHDIVALAREEKDYAVENFLSWFVSEQVEEEASVKTIVQQLKLMGNDGHGLFLTDRELGQRVFVPPASSV